MAQQLDDKRPVFDHSATPNVGRMPAWIRQRLGGDENYALTAEAVRRNALNTVCEEARCPNRAECWSRGTATFMLLGDTCTRACGFCAVKPGKPEWFDNDEPRRVADAVMGMNLNYVVLTSVNRDDLPDGGARIFADTLRELVRRKPDLGIEILTPDFRGCQAEAVTLGQFLRPSRYHLAVQDYVTPAQFDEYAAAVRAMGFKCVKACALVRSSYHAVEQQSPSEGDHG